MKPETILNNLNEICKDKNNIVSHRVSSAKMLTRLLLEGKIIQQGSHNQLVNQGAIMRPYI
jgi:ABC-type bacteriocin/lantibiotic exporter with double-glycine peptidase domain